MTQSSLFGEPEAVFIVTDDDFQALWLSGAWRKLGRKEAYRHFRKTVKTPDDLKRIHRARDNYSLDLERNPRPALHGSTFFNNWEDYATLAIEQVKPNGTRSTNGDQHGRFEKYVRRNTGSRQSD